MTLSQYDIVRVSARFKNSISGDVVNVWHWQANGNITDTDSDIMDAIESTLDDMWTQIASHVMEEQDPYDIRFDVVDWVAGKETVQRVLGTRSWTLTNPPSNTQDGLPQMDCALINARTPLPKTFGRKYLGTLSEGNIADGSLTGTVLSAIGSFIGYWLTDIALTGGDLVPGVLTYKTNGALGHFAQFVSAVANAVIGTQRRRRQNRGS